MNQRYQRIYNISTNTFIVGAPMIIVGGGLLIDHKTNRTIAQFKFKNISKQDINCLILSFSLDDPDARYSNNIFTFQYHCKAEPQSFFGEKTAIPIEVENATAIYIEAVDVVFADGSIWSSPDEAFSQLDLPDIEASPIERRSNYVYEDDNAEESNGRIPSRVRKQYKIIEKTNKLLRKWNKLPLNLKKQYGFRIGVAFIILVGVIGGVCFAFSPTAYYQGKFIPRNFASDYEKNFLKSINGIEFVEDDVDDYLYYSMQLDGYELGRLRFYGVYDGLEDRVRDKNGSAYKAEVKIDFPMDLESNSAQDGLLANMYVACGALINTMDPSINSDESQEIAINCIESTLDRGLEYSTELDNIIVDAEFHISYTGDVWFTFSCSIKENNENKIDREELNTQGQSKRLSLFHNKK